MPDTPHTAFFGDREREFRITPKLISELERVTGAGIGALFRRVASLDFRHTDIVETIRLGLIGGGEKPENASALVSAYANGRPYLETVPLALAILEHLWFGAPQQAEMMDGAAS